MRLGPGPRRHAVLHLLQDDRTVAEDGVSVQLDQQVRRADAQQLGRSYGPRGLCDRQTLMLLLLKMGVKLRPLNTPSSHLHTPFIFYPSFLFFHTSSFLSFILFFLSFHLSLSLFISYFPPSLSHSFFLSSFLSFSFIIFMNFFPHF